MKLFRTDGTHEEMDLRTDLDTLQKHVGGYIEFFRFKDGSALVVNEEGKLIQLPVNKTATVLTQAKGQPEMIVGDCLFLTRDEMRLMRKAS